MSARCALQWNEKTRRNRYVACDELEGTVKIDISQWHSGESCPQGGLPTVSPAQRVAVGKEEQGSGRMTSFLPQA